MRLGGAGFPGQPGAAQPVVAAVKIYAAQAPRSLPDYDREVWTPPD